MSVSRSIIIAGLFALTPLLASGEEASLTPDNITLAAEACASGVTPVPELSDFGHETGQYAVPIADEHGTIYSAVLMSANDIDNVETCAQKLNLLRTEWASGEQAETTSEQS